MTELRWRKIEELFHATLARPAAERGRLLDDACADDSGLRDEVESLLSSHEQASSGIIEQRPFELEPRAVERPAAPLSPGQRIGQYTLRDEIGRGGSGIVYEAEQDDPKRLVALKIIRALPLRDELTSRLFRREGRALARLDHAGIAAIHEAGLSGDDRYYLAMERVEGLPLTAYAGARQLSLRQRLELFIRVCDAVHYAHQRGVIHRDLKPSNILVTAAGQPKVLDFGLARITDPDGDLTRVTESGAFHGTLAYASPEHFRGRADEIDVRSDVYSLGVILYELLSGERPYEIGGLSLPQAARVICEHPSRQLREKAPALRGELETIVGKALEKEPDRRYASAAALGDDIARYLARRPIAAHPPSTTYLLRKLIARHKLPFALAAMLALAVVGAAIGTGWLALRLVQERDVAREANASAEEFAGFLETLFQRAEPFEAKSEAPALRQVLDDGYARLDRIEKPLVRARLMTVIGGVYTNLHEFLRGRELLDAAVAIRRRELGNDSLDLADSLAKLAGVAGYLEDLDSYEAAARETLDIRRRHYGDDHPRMAAAWDERGSGYFYHNEFALAAECFRKSLDILRRQHAGPNQEVAGALQNLGRALAGLNQTEDAERCLREALAMRRELNDPAQTELVLEGIALLVFSSNPAEAETAMREGLALGRIAYHDQHPRLAWILTNYAYVVAANHGAAEAEPAYREAVDIYRKVGAIDGHLARAIDMFGDCLFEQGKRDDAISLWRESVELWRRLFGPDDSRTLRTQKRLDEALIPREE